MAAEVKWDTTQAEAYIGMAVEAVEKSIATQLYVDVKNSSKFSDKTGKLRRSIRLYKSKFEGGGYVVHADAPHAHLVEYGTADRYDLVNKRFTGAMPAKPFMRPAARKYKAKFQTELKDKLGEVLK